MRIRLMIFIFFTFNFILKSQDTRTQYPLLLLNAYFEVNIGYVNYPFSDLHMLPGYSAEHIEVPHTAVRIIPYGYNINEYFSAQISYMRPVLWVRYKNVNGDNGNHAVFTNLGGITLKAKLPVYKNLSIYGEAGLAVVTRSGFRSGIAPYPVVMEDANYASYLLGGGIKYSLNKKWNFMLSTAYTPAQSESKQPYTIYYAGGFAFNMFALPEETVKENANTEHIFPRNMIQIGYTTNAFGYGVNNFVSEGPVPIFWGGEAEIKNGITVHYQRNAFHGRKVFSLDWGASFTYNISNVDNDKFFTLSIFPLFRFTLIHTRPADFYLNYSLAGPTYISGQNIDGEETGPKFTFQDFMGAGFYFGPTRKFNAEMRIAHYSNGNLFPQNAGVKIPLTFNLGYTF